MIDIAQSRKEIVDIFRFYEFGITEFSKRDIYKISKQSGLYNIMKHTWFCHTPINGKPCGTCNPCKDAMNEGMKFRLPLSARIRYYRLYI